MQFIRCTFKRPDVKAQYRAQFSTYTYNSKLKGAANVGPKPGEDITEALLRMFEMEHGTI